MISFQYLYHFYKNILIVKGARRIIGWCMRRCISAPARRYFIFPFVPPLIFSQSARWIFVFLFCAYFLFESRWRDERYHLPYIIFLYLSRKDHLFVVFYHAFSSFWLPTFFLYGPTTQAQLHPPSPGSW